MIIRATSASNATLKRLRSLREKKYRKAEGLFLAEGLRICTEALQAGWIPEILLFAEGKGEHALVRHLVQATLAHQGQVLETTPALLSTVTGKDNPQTVAAAWRPRPLALADLVPGRRTLVAERLRDPGNLGTLLRSCDATATSAFILLDECTDPWSVEAVRASMGACFTIPVVEVKSSEFLRWKEAHGATLIGAALDPRAVRYRDARYPPPSLLMVGNEAHGLPPPLLEASDQLVGMPMLGKADSLNVAMAGTLLLYEALAWQGG